MEGRKIEEACTIASTFIKLYYESMDKKIHLIGKMYLDTAQLIWNGNGVTGSEAIQKFWMELPPAKYTVSTMDAQPILAVTNTPDRLTVLVRVSGQVKFEKQASMLFTQTFTVFPIEDKWKIVNDTFRLQDSQYLNN